MSPQPFPTADARRAAGVELVMLAEHLATPRTTFAQALDVARSARPDLAATVDAGFAAPAPSTSRQSSGPRSAVPASAHQQLVMFSEQLRSADPTMTAEQAFANALETHPELYAAYLDQRANGQTTMQFGDRLGHRVGGGHQPISRDGEFDARPQQWALRARELHAEGAASTVEGAYALAMAESPATDSSVRHTVSPAPSIDTGDGANHARWSARASELYKSGRAKTWQQGYSDAMRETDG